MTEVRASSQLGGTTRLWRYLSLDKLVDLLATGDLFFAPLASFVSTDPFEGYLPAAAMEAHAGIFRSVIKDFESAVSALEDHGKKTNRQVAADSQQMLRHKLDDLKAAPAIFFQAINQCIAVNCWHANDFESEAMWRLYADNGNAVAIETSVDALKESIESRQSEHVVHVYRVKYLDFFDKNLKPAECVVEGHLTPLLKRLSYSHECEVRAFVGRVPKNTRESLDVNYWKPAPVRVPVDLTALVKRVHVSPYSREPFESSVAKVCEMLGLPATIVKPSKMLSGHEELLKSFNY